MKQQGDQRCIVCGKGFGKPSTFYALNVHVLGIYGGVGQVHWKVCLRTLKGRTDEVKV